MRGRSRNALVRVREGEGATIKLLDMSRNERQPGCTFARKTQRHFAAKTLRGTGNKNVLTREFSHSRNLLPLSAVRHTPINQEL
jgi:hypothetical protein